MEHNLILAHSITHAQRMERLLAQGGIRSGVFRAPTEITSRGCAYVVQIDTRELSASLKILYAAGLGPFQIFHSHPHGHQEVPI